LTRAFQDRPSIASSAIKLALVAVFTALSLATNYVMIGIPNVKLMDAFVFVAAFMFGVDVGVGVAVLTWTVYGFINPYGQAGPILLIFLITGECFYAMAGAVLSRTRTAKALVANGIVYGRIGTIFGLVGLIATFGYDVLTNFATYLFVTSSLYQALLVGIITGAPFAIIHELSNLIFFATVAPGTIIAARRFGWR
jgi:uncharacterized membrane protein